MFLGHTHSLSLTCQDVQICEAFLKGFERKRRTFCIFRIDLAVCEAKFQQHAHHVNSFLLEKRINVHTQPVLRL